MMLAAAVFNGGAGLAAVPALRSGRVGLARMLRAQGLWITVAGGALLGTAALLVAGGAPARWAAGALGWDWPAAAAAAAGTLALLAFDILFYDALAEGRPVAGALANLARAAVQLGLVCGLVLAASLSLSSALGAYAVGQCVGVAGVLIFLVRTARRPGRAVGLDDALPLPRLARRTLAEGWMGQLSAVASLLHQRLDLALVTVFHGPATAGVYSVAILVGELLGNLPAAISPLLVYSSAGATQGSEGDRFAARAVRVGLAATAAAAVPLAVVAGPLLPWLFGPAYVAAPAALRARLPGAVALAVGTVLAGDFIGRGRSAWNTQAGVLTAAVNAVAGVLLIPRWGIVGAGAAASLAYLCGSLWMLARFCRVTGIAARAVLFPRRTRTLRQ
jgi:O-antigen/teichoic acid export membrane protein